MNTYNGNSLYGKKWACCGDSFTAGVTGTLITEGRFKGQNIAYPYLIAERNNMVNRPFAHIGILVSNGCDRPAYRTAQIELAAKFGIPYIDMNGDRFTPVMIRSMNPDIPEEVKQAVKIKQAADYPANTHPNDRAHEFESWFIEDFLRRI